MKRKIAIGVLIGIFVLSGCGSRNIAIKGDRTINESRPNSEEYISEERAIEIALEDAEVDIENVYLVRSEIDTERGRKIYEVGFGYDGYEFNYDIDAITGDILEREVEIED